MNIPEKKMPDLNKILIRQFTTSGADDPTNPPARLATANFVITFDEKLAHQEHYDLRYILTNAFSAYGKRAMAVDVCMANILRIPGQSLRVLGYKCAVVETIEDVCDKVTNERTCDMPFGYHSKGVRPTDVIFDARMGLVNCQYSEESGGLSINFGTLSSKGRESFSNNPNITHNSASITISGSVELSFIARDFDDTDTSKPRYVVEAGNAEGLGTVVDVATSRTIVANIPIDQANEAATNLNTASRPSL